MYKLKSYFISTPIERIRGESDITVPLTCILTDNNSKEYQIVLIGNCKNSQEIPATVEQLLSTAPAKLESVMGTVSSSGKTTNEMTKVIRTLVSPSVATELKKSATNRSEYDKMMDVAAEDKQEKVANLCEALGIDVIDVLTNAWTNVEVLVLINYLERMANPLTN